MLLLKPKGGGIIRDDENMFYVVIVATKCISAATLRLVNGNAGCKGPLFSMAG